MEWNAFGLQRQLGALGEKLSGQAPTPWDAEYNKKRERVISIITQKNNLQRMADSLDLEIQRLEKEIEAAESTKQERLIELLRTRQGDYKNARATVIESLSDVQKEVDSIKAELGKEMETYRRLRESRRFFPRY